MLGRMDSDENSARADEASRSWIQSHDGAVVWRNDVRMGWMVSDGPLSDACFYAIRNRDGKTIPARDRQGLIAAMTVADVSSTLNQAFAAGADPELPDELR